MAVRFFRHLSKMGNGKIRDSKNSEKRRNGTQELRAKHRDE